MKKISLLSFALLPLFLWGCSLDFSTKTEINTANEYYKDQIKPTVDKAVDTTKEKADEMVQKAKSGYNDQVDKATDYVKDQIGTEMQKLKIE